MLLYDHCRVVAAGVTFILTELLSIRSNESGSAILLAQVYYSFSIDTLHHYNLHSSSMRSTTPDGRQTCTMRFLYDPSENNKLTVSSCDRIVSFEGYTTVGLVAVCELVMILRIFALYGRNYWILGFLLVVLAVQIIISSYGLSFGTRVPLPPGFVGCIFTGPPNKSLFPAIWYAPAITDFIIFCLTLYRTMKFIRNLRSTTPLIHQFTRDGVLYFAVIFSANMINVIIYQLAVEDLKAIGASFSQMITSVMVSRLVLNLRGVGEQPRPRPNLRSAQQPNDIMTRTIGNLGEEFRTWKEDISSGWSHLATSGARTLVEEGNALEMQILSEE
ncbi:hypothetical protein E1B28_003852 [Marasmius oreades]|uniref:Uncharacterized protein n=1 Tax=Marasmius oreades TaxID=181124 RepID=A0A9P7UXD3_9AGAR|nr:uncharacterized protein E1B28_003852 [Marasmius oreades]KAG7096412.1 hypothetical protein E1B28_003852 [Marasmius oreades]